MYRTACICPSMILLFLVNLAVRMGHTFLKLMDAHVPFFSLKLVYAGDTLMEAVLNGERIR